MPSPATTITTAASCSRRGTWAGSRAARRRRRIVAAQSALSPTEIQRGFSSDRCGLCLVCVYSYCSLESTILLHDGDGGGGGGGGGGVYRLV